MIFFSLGVEEEYMDKISRALVLGIALLVLTSGVIVYDTWLSDKSIQMEAETIVEDVQTGDDLIFNDDTSIKNNSQRKLWIRVKPVYDNEYDPQGYKIISEAIERGEWMEGYENWYYYNIPIRELQTTEPLVDTLLYNGQEVSADGNGRFSLQVEAVDEEWFVKKPHDGIEAFEVFRETMAIPDKTYL